MDEHLNAIEQRLDSIVADDRRALKLVEEPRPENTSNRPASVIRAHGEKERCPGVVPAQDLEQARHPLAGSTQRINVDFEGK